MLCQDVGGGRDHRGLASDPPAGTAYYYVRGEQEDGELVWVSPMWITRK